MKKQTVFLTILLAAFFSMSASVQLEEEGGERKKKDTVQAVVLYGEEMLFASIDNLSDERISNIYDSLSRLSVPPLDLMSKIDLFLSVKSMSKDEVAFLMDSLFEADEVEYALINQINMYIINHPPEELDETAIQGPNQRILLPYPAHDRYLVWNTSKPHPYPISLFRNDLTESLDLTGDEFGDYASPLEKIVVTSKFGWREGRSHRGYDLDLQVWDPVSSIFDGVVRFAGYYGGYGRVVVVRHYNGLETLYAHLHRFKVKKGQEVKAGDVIGLGGSSGHSTGSHLHLECRYKGIALDPGTFIDFKKKKLVSNKILLKKDKYGYASIPDGVPFHTVAAGDSLYEIAKKYGTSIARLCEINNIRRNNFLRVGQRIRII